MQMQEPVIEDIVSIHGVNIDLGILRTDQKSILLYTQWLNNEDIKKWMGYGSQVINFDQISDWVHNKRTIEDCAWSIFEKTSRRMIGTCSCRLVRGTKNAHIDVCIGHPTDRLKGYGTEAIKLMIAFAFEDMNAHRVEIKINSENILAIQSFTNCGFVECGRLHEHDYFNCHYSDVIIMEIIKKDWLSKRLVRKSVAKRGQKPKNIKTVENKIRDISKEEDEILLDVPNFEQQTTDDKTDDITEETSPKEE